MKKTVALIFAILFALSCFACSSSDDVKENSNYLDLAAMSNTAATVYIQNMGNFPDQFVGKTIKIKGSWTKAIVSDVIQYQCLVYDETGCCAYGLDVALADGVEAPIVGQEITVEGQFETYMSGITRKIRIKDAVIC